MKMQANIFIITGSQGSGKTTFLKEVIRHLKMKNISVGGIVAEGFWKNEKRDRFHLVDQINGEHIVFCQREEKRGWEKVRNYYINPLGQKFGEQALHLDNNNKVDIIVIDEIGPFELEGKGWAKSITNILKETNTPMIWVIRKSLIQDISNKWKVIALSTNEPGKSSPIACANEIIHLISNTSSI